MHRQDRSCRFPPGNADTYTPSPQALYSQSSAFIRDAVVMNASTTYNLIIKMNTQEGD